MARKKGGYGKVDCSIILDPTLTPEARLIYTCLSCYADKSRECYPSVETLIRNTGMSKDRFYRHLKLLEQRGIIEKHRIKSVNLCRGIIYKLCDSKGQGREE